MLPEIQFDHRSIAFDKDLEMRRRFRARISLNLALGDYDVVNKLELGTQSILVDAEKFWLEGKDGDDAGENLLGHIGIAHLDLPAVGQRRGVLGEL